MVPEKCFLEKDITIDVDLFDPKSLKKNGALFKESNV